MKPNRREFLADAAFIAGGAVLTADARLPGAGPAVHWPIGCFNRPWAAWPFDETLQGVKAAGYGVTGLLTRTKDDPFIAADATGEYLDRLKRAIAGSGVSANMAALSSRHDILFEDTVSSLRKQIDNAAFLGVKSVMTFGIDDPAQYDHYFKAMAEAAAYASGKGIRLVMKPHGGSSGASGEILAAIGKVRHPNFKIWYDAGNIIHYTGKDPVEELRPIAAHVTGFCAKDCAKQKGDVMIQFGRGKVDFKAVFRVLKAAGFNGPIMVECCAPGETPSAVSANAKANRNFLDEVLAGV